MHQDNDEDQYAIFEPSKPFWHCQSCGYKDHNKPMPKDKSKYHQNPKPGKCKKCKSEDMAPSGF